MSNEQKNKIAAIFLQGKIKDGEVFEETPPDHPVLVTLGQDSFFPAIENELPSMKIGETRTFNLSPEEAYGPHHEHLVQKIDKSAFGNTLTPQPGMVLSQTIESEDGPKKIPATITEVSKEHVTIDYNHPLAGKNVIYTVTLQNWIE